MNPIATPLDSAVIAGVVTHTVDALTPQNLFGFNAPRQTLVGQGAVLKIGSLLQAQAARHVLIVADRAVYERGLLAPALRSLARAAIEVTVFSGVEHEPGAGVVDRGVAMLEQCGADFVLGFGGGSALDAAKAIAVLASCHCDLPALAAADFAGVRSIGLAAVPTTAGTGSEVTDISVIISADGRHKVVAKQAALMPDLAVIDPSLMRELPASITAATGIDALTHAIEAYVASSANPLSRALAISAIQTIARALPVAVGNGGKTEARLCMALAAYKAGLAFSNSGLGLVHAISHQVGARYDIAHGVANGILLPHVMAFNALVCRSEYAAIAAALGVSREGMSERQQCDAGIAAVARLLADIGLPDNLARFGGRAADFTELAAAALEDICIKANPRCVTEADVIQLLQQAMGPPAAPRAAAGC